MGWGLAKATEDEEEQNELGGASEVRVKERERTCEINVSWVVPLHFRSREGTALVVGGIRSVV